MSDSGKVSRRSALTAGLTILAGVSSAVRAQDSDEPPKLSKNRVHYQYTWNTLGSHCSICANFIAPNGCHIVDGGISLNGYCRVFSPQDVDLNK